MFVLLLSLLPERREEVEEDDVVEDDEVPARGTDEDEDEVGIVDKAEGGT